MEKSNYHSANSENQSAIIKSFSNTRLCKPLRKGFLSALDSCVNALAIYHHTIMDPNCADNVNGFREVSENNADRCEILCKLERDSTYVRELLEDVKSEVADKGTYDTLINLIDESSRKEREENDVLMNYVTAQKIVEDLKKEIEEEMKNNESEMEMLRGELNDLREEKQKVEWTAKREIRYASAWEKTQCEQSTLRCNKALEHLRTSLEDCLIRKKNENRVSREIIKFLKQNIEFNVKAAENWEERYNREMQIYTLKNNQLRKEIESKSHTLDVLEAKFRERQEFIDEYLADKEAEKIERELEEHKKNSAILIQSWWRGVMVRRKLGPYRPDEKKKKKPTKSKK